MKIDLNKIDQEHFVVREGEVAGETCYLVFPKSIGAKWTKDNLIYRSSIWNKDGEPVSLGFKKFFNWNEQPDLAYTPFSLKANGGCQVVEKIDGSTLIVSKYKGQIIHRTRGTFDASQLENGHEIELLKEKYPQVFEFGDVNTYDGSWIYEWVTPLNKIVIGYDEPELFLIGHIDHDDYHLLPQTMLSQAALYLGVSRPKTYHFNSVKEMLEEVSLFEGKEGVCCYCNYGQDIRKIKGEWYLKLHRMKNELGSFDRVVDFYFANGEMGYQETYDTICETLDFEIAEQCKGDVSKICDAMKKVARIEQGMKVFVDFVKNMSRKEAAQNILQAYGKTNRASFVFSLLDGKELTADQRKKLVYQILKK